MASLNQVSQQQVYRRASALTMNIQAAKGLQEVLKTNLGPKGTIKMLVSGGGEVRLTKDGNVLLKEMQIQSPTAALIARVATAQDNITGDGTTSNVLLVAELLKQSERYLEEGVHPAVLTEGFELAKRKALSFLDEFKVKKEDSSDVELLMSVARTSLRSKLRPDLADQVTSIVVEAVQTVAKPGKPIDLFMVEQMMMLHKSEADTRLVKGLVLDHGARHPDMPRVQKNCFILTCNVSLEYEKTEVNSGFYYNDASKRQEMVEDERRFIDERVKQVIELKRKVCDTPDKSFVMINQKGIDIQSLDMLAKAGIRALRRAKRRNMERLTLACGGVALNSFEELSEASLGHAEHVWEQTLGEDKFTFIDGVSNPQSCTILIKGPHKHNVTQIKDALRDGLRAVKNTIEDGCVVPGAGSFEVGASLALSNYLSNEVQGRKKLGVKAFADALLIIPKTLAKNAGLDPTDIILELTDAHRAGHSVGVDLDSGDPLEPDAEGIWDNYRVKRQLINSMADIGSQLLLIDEIIKSGSQK